MSQQQTGSAFARENSQHWVGVEADDIPQGWMDDMVKRVLDVINRSLIRLETAQAKVNDTERTSQEILKEVAQHARLTSQLRADLEKMREVEIKRQANKPKVTVSDDETRASIKRRLDRVVAAGLAKPDSDGTAGE